MKVQESSGRSRRLKDRIQTEIRLIWIYQSRIRGNDEERCLSLYVFCVSGEMGPGVLVPSKLCAGTVN